MIGPEAWGNGLWPIAVLILVGVLPSEIWRVAAAVLARWVDEESEVFVLVRLVATALVAAVVAKLLVQPPPALAVVPLPGRAGAVAVAVAVYLGTGRRLLPGMAAGLLLVVALAWLHETPDPGEPLKSLSGEIGGSHDGRPSASTGSAARPLR